MIPSDNYTLSNSIVAVHYNKLSSREYKTLLLDTNRQVDGQKLLDYLCDKYCIKRIPLYIRNNRPVRNNGQTYGFYKLINGVGVSITIYNKTAKTNKEISIKSFVNTLLHEFIHHYDTHYLKLNSIHSKGFYMRISDLEKKLQK